jgi:hypothetical protein
MLTDRVLALWRSGNGPDATLVLEAALNASCGLATDAPQQTTRFVVLRTPASRSETRFRQPVRILLPRVSCRCAVAAWLHASL